MFVCLMIRRPPRSTLFPTRRSSDLGEEPLHDLVLLGRADRHPRPASGDVFASAVGDLPDSRRRLADGLRDLLRSEEHTSELQSRQYLVCRLLLEKKKTSRETQNLGS